MKTIFDFAKAKNEKRKITMITCYDYTSACIVADTNIDAILVGDSLGMVMHGFPNTVSTTIDLTAIHISAVARGLKNKFIVGDMPFLSYRKDLKSNMEAVEKIMQAGAHAIKLEGAKGNLELVRHIVDSGVPVMGHIGLTPQHINMLGGWKVQGKNQEQYDAILKDAKDLEQAGCFSLVLECVPAPLATAITNSLNIPTIGIGAGPNTDGQILVLQDMLGLQPGFKPKFLKNYLNGKELMVGAINSYVGEVVGGAFPNGDQSYL